MRKAFLASLVWLAMAAPVFAQSTAITATVRDSSNIPYSFARVSAQLVPTGTAPTVGGRQVDGTAFSQLDANGVLNMNLWDNGQILPANSRWQITVCESPGVQPPLGTGSQCFTITATITGATQSLTTAMNAAAPSLTNITLGSVGFSSITGGTNIMAAMLLGTGASLGPTGAGILTANRFTPAGVNGNCARWGAGGILADAGGACGAIAAGTNQQVTYNDAGTAAGATGLLWDKINNRQAILLTAGQTLDPWFIEDSALSLKASFKVDGGGYFPYFNAGLSGGAITSTTGGVRLTKTDFLAFRNNANGGDIPGVALNTVDQIVLGGISGIASPTNCADSAGPAACGSAYAGAVVVDAGAVTVVVSTTAVTANSEIFIQYDSSMGARLGVTCNVTVALPSVTARTAGASFTITVPAAPIVNPACYSYHIVN